MANSSSKGDDTFMEDELAAAFLEDDAQLADAQVAADDQDWGDDGAPDTPGQLAVDVYESAEKLFVCLLYTSPSPRDATLSRMPSSA